MGRFSGGGPLPFRQPMSHEEAFRTNAVVRYLFHEMDVTESEDYEAHFFDCCICAREVTLCSELLAGLQKAVASSSAPAEQFRRCRVLIRSYVSRIT